MRGPKPKTAKNSRKRAAKPAVVASLSPVSDLSPIAYSEFSRLVEMMDNRGTLDRVDVAVMTELARVKERLDKAYANDETRVINQLTTQRRGLLRELGLTLQPSRVHFNTTMKAPAVDEDPLAGCLKVHG